MMLRGVRGAITVDENTKEEIVSRTQELLRAIVTVNECNCDNCAIDCERKRRPQKRLV